MKNGTEKQSLLLSALALLISALFIGLWFFTDTSAHFFIFLFALLLAVILTIALPRVIIEQRSAYRRKARTITETKLKLRRQQESLLKLVTSAQIHSGKLEVALPTITESACNTLGTEQASIWLFNDDKSSLYNVESYNCETGRHSKGRQIERKYHSEYFEEIPRHRALVAPDIEKETFSSTFKHLGAEGIRSIMDIPFYHAGQLSGVVCIAARGCPRNWTSDEQLFACALADIVAIAYEANKRNEMEGTLTEKSLAIEASADGIGILDDSRRYLYVNKAYADIYGMNSPAELVGKKWESLYHPGELKRLASELIPTLRKTGTLRFEAKGVRKSGEEFPQEVTLTVIPRGGLICIIRDISERKQTQERIIENERFLRSVLDADPNFIFIKDREGRFVLVNDAVCEVYGTTQDELIGKKDADFNDNTDEVEHYRKIDLRVIDENISIHIPEEKITDSTGKLRWLSTVKKPFVTSSGERMVLGVASDITERKRLESQLLQSQKMEAVGQLAGGIAHDFNNLLTGILGHTAIIKLENESNPNILQYANLIEDASYQASELTHKLLGFARKGKHQNIAVNVHSSILDTLSLVTRTFEKNITLVQSLEAHVPLIQGDPVQIQQVFLNLALNARDAITGNADGSRGGELRIGTRIVSSETVESQSGQCPSAAKCFLEVSFADTGGGIPEELKDKIFEPFFTTKKAQKGSGMGLAMVYGIVRNHGGCISVDSKKDVGTTFKVYFPCIESPMPNKQVEEQSAPAKGKGNILVVDDHEIIREVAQRLLAYLGYNVVTASNGEEALKIFKDCGGEIDLAILDLVMPKMGAKECFFALRRMNPQLKVIISTGYGRNNAVQELLDEGACDFLQKPYKVNQIAETVAKTLGIRPQGMMDEAETEREDTESRGLSPADRKDSYH